MFTQRIFGFSKRMRPAFPLLAALVLFLFTGCASIPGSSSAAVYVEVDDVQYLESYGEWIYVSPYGMTWRPHVVSGWAPFYHGHWIRTYSGWTWTSYEPYGWLVYHYGNWGFRPDVGWFWVPGDTWYPATVQWYTFGNYTAWAPLPPPGIVWADPWDPYDIDIWIVIDVDNFTQEDIGRHRVSRPVYRKTISRRDVVKRAPDVRHVEEKIKKRIVPVKVRERTVDIRSRVASTARKPARSGESKLKRIVLPKTQQRTVEKKITRVEREVLAPRTKTPVKKQRTSKTGTDVKTESRETQDRSTGTSTGVKTQIRETKERSSKTRADAKKTRGR